MAGGRPIGTGHFPLLARTILVGAAVAAGALGTPTAGSPALGALVGLAAGLGGVLVERRFEGAAPRRVLGGLAGLILGLLAARLLPFVAPEAQLLAALALGWVGVSLGARELSRLQLPVPKAVEPTLVAALPRPSEAPVEVDPLAKVIDTSVIIDGRISDVVASGFLEGRLIVPQFVIRELQQVADSSDPLKRARGRKGLDVLKILRESQRIAVELIDRDFPEVDEVDAKLILLAEEAGAKILTNDYNLNKVAQLRGISVLNVNDLANAVKPVVLPGESLTVQVIKEGKERNQGVGYLDDGTMVVVDNARDLLGERLEVLVTSVIQTNAGKMIFAAPDDEHAEQTFRIARRRERPDRGDRSERLDLTERRARDEPAQAPEPPAARTPAGHDLST